MGEKENEFVVMYKTGNVGSSEFLADICVGGEIKQPFTRYYNEETGKEILPASGMMPETYKNAECFVTTPVSDDARIGIGFLTENGEKFRFSIPLENFVKMISGAEWYIKHFYLKSSQSDKSSDIPSLDASSIPGTDQV